MTTQGKLIGIVGYKGSGKTTLSKAAISTWNGPRNCVKIGFSDPIINMLHAMDVPLDILDDKSRWNEPLDILGGHSLRYAGQTLGTEWGREHLGVDVWTNIAMRRADEHRARGQHVIVDNVRFPNEFETFRRNGATIIGIQRPDLPVDTSHESEQHILGLWGRIPNKYFIVNNGTFAEGVEAIRKLIVDIIAE